MKRNINLLQNKGFDILFSDESFPKIKFFDIGALVYFAKIIEWEFPQFSVDSCFENLFELEKDLQNNKFIEGIGHRFVIVAKNQ